MRKCLKITLCSDLCAAEGKHYAAMIDLDTALDKYGLPYIPSRRLKGCLRETAEYFFEKEELDSVFGVSGNDVPGSLRIGDAHFEHYYEDINEIKSKKLNAAKVTDLFCSVRSETAIEGDTVKDGSLRFIRVVNMHSPVNGKPLEFFADIEFDDKYEQLIKKAVGCLRNIGYHRNRGFGAVKCELTDRTENTADDDACRYEAGKRYNMRFTVKLTGDLMLPDTDGSHSGDYIAGSSVLGAFAAAYVKKYPDGDFNSMFITNDVRFGNLYVASAGKEHFNYYTPAPRFLAKIKAATDEKDKGIKNLLQPMDAAKTYKPLKKGYLNPVTGLLLPERKIVYHNSSVKSEDQLLYMQYCLCKDQYFSGEISASGEKMKILKELCDSGCVSFGRSKTAQYGSCDIIEAKVTEAKEDKVELRKGSVAAYVLESDVVLTDANGIFTVDYKALCDELGTETVGKTKDEPSSVAVAAKTISGYNSKWNQKKPQHPVISAGSCIVMEVKEDMKLPEYKYIGEKQNEGFGKVKLISDADKLVVESVKDEPAVTDCGYQLAEIIRERETMNSLLDLAVRNADSCKLNASQVGRLVLMVKDADKFSGDKLDNFESRVNSIKTKTTLENAKKCFSEKALEKALGEVGIQISAGNWKYLRYYMITLLAVKKYRLRKKGEE